MNENTYVDMEWIPVKLRLPTELDCIDGRVATLDSEGMLRYAMLIGKGNERWLLAEIEPEFWLEGIPAAPTKD